MNFVEDSGGQVDAGSMGWADEMRAGKVCAADATFDHGHVLGGEASDRGSRAQGRSHLALVP